MHPQNPIGHGHPGHPHAHPQGHPHTGKGPQQRKLHLLAWETTRACRFACPHCRASAVAEREEGELTTSEGKKLLTEAARVGPSIIIISGGEPLIRQDLEELIAHGKELGHTMVIACNDGELLSAARVASLKKAGVQRFSFSLHSANAAEQDQFLVKKGAFNHIMEAFERLKAEQISFQINTTVLPSNADHLPEILAMAKRLGAAAWHLFFVVATGRAVEGDAATQLKSETIEKVLEWVADIHGEPDQIPMKVTCAPHHARIFAKKGRKLPGHGRSCMAGDGFAFVSSRGEVKPCGYFDMVAGNVRETPFDEIYSAGPLFKKLRDLDSLEGNCGACEYRRICGGCRARAFSTNGNYMGPDPACKHVPAGNAVKKEQHGEKG